MGSGMGHSGEEIIEGYDCLGRAHSVAKGAQSVHPTGNPMRASTNRGFNCRPEVLGDIAPITLGAWRPSSPFVGALSEGSVPSL